MLTRASSNLPAQRTRCVDLVHGPDAVPQSRRRLWFLSARFSVLSISATWHALVVEETAARIATSGGMRAVNSDAGAVRKAAGDPAASCRRRERIAHDGQRQPSILAVDISHASSLHQIQMEPLSPAVRYASMSGPAGLAKTWVSQACRSYAWTASSQTQGP